MNLVIYKYFYDHIRDCRKIRGLFHNFPNKKSSHLGLCFLRNDSGPR